jgi:uncharacterized protein
VSAFSIPLAELPAGHSELRLEAAASAVGLDPEAWPHPLTLAVSVDRRGNRITFRGTAETRVREECPRCLSAFESALTFEFTAFSERAADARGTAREAEEDGIIVHDGRTVVLDDQVREQAILARPMLAYCRPDCAGLCPRCGDDRNVGPCRCEAATA